MVEMKSKIIQRRKLVLGGLLVFLVFSSILYQSAIASDDDDESDEDDDGVDDDIEDENRRSITIEYDDDEATVESQFSSGEVENSFTAEMKATSGGLEYSLEFEKEIDSNETEIEFEITLSKLIEFIDENGNGTYEPLIDTIASEYEIDTYNPIEYSVETINNHTVHVFTVETSDGVFSSTMYVSGEFVLINETFITPTEFKFDILINNFTFTEADSYLALKIELESELEVDYEEDEETEDEKEGRSSDEQEVEIDYGNYTGFFSWLKTATVDNIEYDINASQIENVSDVGIMYLSYPQGDEIIHDPKAGIEGLIIGWPDPTTTNFWVNLPNLSQNELLIVSAISFFVIISLVMVFRRKKIA
ncbi:MAG: hypothetical protein ACTSSN_04445 [Candidatus Heimdallarchaeaceae archaeon]